MCWAGPVKSPREALDRGLATIYQEVLVADEASVFDNLYAGQEEPVASRAGRAKRERIATELLGRFTGAEVDLRARVGDLPLSLNSGS